MANSNWTQRIRAFFPYVRLKILRISSKRNRVREIVTEASFSYYVISKKNIYPFELIKDFFCFLFLRLHLKSLKCCKNEIL